MLPAPNAGMTLADGIRNGAVIGCNVVADAVKLIVPAYWGSWDANECSAAGVRGAWVSLVGSQCNACGWVRPTCSDAQSMPVRLEVQSQLLSFAAGGWQIQCHCGHQPQQRP